MRLGMGTGGTFHWCILAFVQVPTVQATPHHFMVTLKNSTILDIGSEIQVPLLMLLLRHSNGLKDPGDLRKTLFSGRPRKLGIHTGPLMILTGCRFL